MTAVAAESPSRDKSRWSEAELQAAGFCGSPRKGFKLSGRRCTVRQFQGSGRCYRHGGRASTLNPDDPTRGGRPATVALEVKSPLYVTKMGESGEQAYRDAELDSLEVEIRVATAMMVKHLEDYAANPMGGVPVGAGRDRDGNPMGTRIMPYSLLVVEMTERLRKLKLSYTELLDRKRTERVVTELREWARNWKPKTEA